MKQDNKLFYLKVSTYTFQNVKNKVLIPIYSGHVFK